MNADAGPAGGRSDGKGGSQDTGQGVEALISRLRAEGVDAGRQQAERLMAQAHEDLRLLRAAADAELRAHRERVEAELQVQREAALGAIRLAWRDALLSLREELEQRLGERLRQRLAPALVPPPSWPALLAPLATADGAAPPANELRALVAELLQALLCQGFEPLPGAPLRVQHPDGGPELHLSDEALASWLMHHAAPHLRRLLEGGA